MLAGSEIEALKTGRAGEVTVGAITGPAVSLLPHAVAWSRANIPTCGCSSWWTRVMCCWNGSTQNKLDIMVGRLFERHDKTNLSYERLADEPVCAVARPGHPMLGDATPALAHLEQAEWIVPPTGSVLRHRFELMFQEAGLDIPPRLIETSSILFTTKMLQESDFIAVVPTEVARYYASYGMLAMLPIQLSCTMDAFGIILRKDWLLSPAAKVVLRALRTAAISVYDYAPATSREPTPRMRTIRNSL